MTAIPSPDAIRSKAYRESRAAHPVPPDVQALLERGRQERAAISKQRHALWELGRTEAMAAARIVKIQNTKTPELRARLLGQLADWIIEKRETLSAITIGIHARHPIPRHKVRRVPSWVPVDLVAVYRDPTITEYEAAALVRKMKREACCG